MAFDVTGLEEQHQDLVEEDYTLYALQLEFKRRENNVEAAAAKMSVMSRIWTIVRPFNWGSS